MLRNLQFAMRVLLKRPAFTLVAVLTLALGIGATSAIFSLIQGVLLTPPPYPLPHQLVLIPPARTDTQKIDDSRGWAAQRWLRRRIPPNRGWRFGRCLSSNARLSRAAGISVWRPAKRSGDAAARRTAVYRSSFARLLAARKARDAS
jgi:hypothetical protein